MNLDELLTFYCKNRNCTPDEIIGRSRIQELAYLRHGFMALCRSQKRFTLKEIGEFLDGRDHSSIINSELAHFALLKDSGYRQIVGLV